MAENLVVNGVKYNGVDYVSFQNESGEKVNYYQGLTEADKAEIAAMVIDNFGGRPVVGYVDENNNIIVQGNLNDGSYSVKYEMEDGSTLNIGNLVIDTNVYYSVANNLTNCTSSNNTKEVVEGDSYSATISANSGYELKTVTVKMGGTDISSSAVSGGKINIANITGNIVITAVAEEKAVTPTYTNLFVPSAATINKRLSSSLALSDAAGFFVTGFIDVSAKIPFTANTKIYVKGANFNQSSAGNHFAKVVSYKSKPASGYTGAYSDVNSSTLKVTDEGNGVVSVSNLASSFVSGVKYMALTLKVKDSTIAATDIQNVVITLDEPIA